MLVKQLSIFLENRTGRLDEVTRILGEADINILALALADTSDFGILRLIVNRPDEAQRVLTDADFLVKTTEVISVEVDDQPGGLARVLDVLKDADVNIEYMYGFVGKKTHKAIMVFRFDDAPAAANILKDADITILDNQQVASL